MNPSETSDPSYDLRAFELSADLICVAGLDGHFKKINPSFVRVLGHCEAELLRKPFIEFVHPDDVAPTQSELQTLVAGEHDSNRLFTNRYRCANGSWRWLEWRAQLSPEDRLIYAAARDVTEQKVIEQKLQAYAIELERSNGELQQFAYVASHDLQEPLRAVAGCVQMLAERNKGNLDARSEELVALAVDGAKRMQTLINDLLAFSRVGNKGISKDRVELKPLVDRALIQLRYAARESDAVITTGLLPVVWADGAQLVQLFQNLIGNSIKFRGQTRPEVHIEAETGRDEVIVSVRDNGIGIEPEYNDRIFGVFQRLHPKAQYPGSGIGLAICKKIVERHDGRIWVESRPGQGATFRFTLPNESKR